MKRIVGIVYVFLCWGISLHAQSVRVIETLKKTGNGEYLGCREK